MTHEEKLDLVRSFLPALPDSGAAFVLSGELPVVPLMRDLRSMGLAPIDTAMAGDTKYDVGLVLWRLQDFDDDEKYDVALSRLWQALRPGGILLVVEDGGIAGESEPRPDGSFPRGFARIAARGFSFRPLVSVGPVWAGVFIRYEDVLTVPVSSGGEATERR